MSGFEARGLSTRRMSLPAPSETEESCEMPPQTSLAHCAKRRQAEEPVPAARCTGAGRGLWRTRVPSPGHYSPGRRQTREGFSLRSRKLVHQNPPGELQVAFISPSPVNFRTRARVPRAQGEEEYLVWRPAPARKVQGSGRHCHHHPDSLPEPQPPLEVRPSAAPHPRLSPGPQGHPAAARR